MKKYQTVTYSKVREFIDNLDRKRSARVDRLYYLFDEYGQFLPTKYLKKVSREIWELRAGDIRLFMSIRGNKGFVVHAIHKKTQKIPKRELDLAIKRIKELL